MKAYKCHKCKTKTENFIVFNNKKYCKDCYLKIKTRCGGCDMIYQIGDMREYWNKLRCFSCIIDCKKLERLFKENG